jgi:ribosomal protein S18 acetylase RimI-like enzyme
MGLGIRPFRGTDVGRVLEITILAWTPVFESFRRILGADLFPIICPDWEADQRRGVEAACRGEDGWSAWVAERDGALVGFVVFRLNHDTGIGELGYNAVHPEHQNSGIGTMMYEFALGRMREGGMRAAKVETGGDSSHAPARRAYEKAGFRPLPCVHYYREL